MWLHLLGALVGAVTGLLFVWLQIWGLKRYARNKEPHVAQRAYEAIGQVMTSNLIGIPLIFSMAGYMAAAYMWPNG